MQYGFEQQTSQFGMAPLDEILEHVVIGFVDEPVQAQQGEPRRRPRTVTSPAPAQYGMDHVCVIDHDAAD